MKKIFLFSLFIFCLQLAADTCFHPPRVKLIHDGWGFQFAGAAPGESSPPKRDMTTRYLRENIEAMEKAIPGSGIIIRFTSPADKCEGAPVNINSIFGGRRIKYEYFKDDLDNLKNTKFKKFTDNFIGLTVSPGNVDWFDDDAWATVCHNHKIASKLAKESGMAGLKLDIEEYHKNTMWQYKPESGHSLAETHAKVRQRGQEFGRALFSEFPDMQLLCYWWFSLARHKNDQSRPEEAEYMVGPFVNGIYDVLPPAVMIHDGNESCAYRANDEVEFYHLGIDLRKNFIRFLDPKHLAKYRAQTFLAPGIYVDPHFNPKPNYWNNQLQPDLERLGGAKLLKRNLFNAMEAADRYVWMWHERFVWFPSTHPAKPALIPSVAPGITEELDLILDPMPRAAEIVREKNLKNLALNGDFSKQPSGNQNIPNFGEWHGEKGKGKFLRKEIAGNPAAVAVGVKNGCIYQSRKVVPGEMYLVRCSASGLKPGRRTTATFRVNWKRTYVRGGKTFDDRFNDYLVRTHFFRRLGEGKKDTAEFVVIVPEGAMWLEMMLSVNKADDGEEICFDDLELYKIMD